MDVGGIVGGWRYSSSNPQDNQRNPLVTPQGSVRSDPGVSSTNAALEQEGRGSRSRVCALDSLDNLSVTEAKGN